MFQPINRGNSTQPALPNWKYRTFEYFNTGGGAWFSARVMDLHFKLWKWAEPGTSFADYYAGTVAAGLRRGGSHKTLGDKRFLSGSVLGATIGHDHASHSARGRDIFHALLAYGIERGAMCVDFGCGSLRIGQHFIAYLDPGKYVGLDMIADFYEAGLRMLPNAVLADKRPSFGLIETEKLSELAHRQPDFIVSTSVLKHVPPGELEAYFRKVVAMMGRKTTALITFDAAKESVRKGGSNWDYSVVDLAACVRRANPALKCSFENLWPIGAASRTGHAAIMRIAAQ
jgi:hypothetical protein